MRRGPSIAGGAPLRARIEPAWERFGDMGMGNRISIASLDGAGSFHAYRADPEGSPRAAVIVIQEIFGVNPGIRRKVDDWAAQGYLALAPDMFWRFAPDVELDPDRPEELQQALGLMGHFDVDKAVLDIEAAIRWARAETGGKVGLVGFCLGGRLAYLAATRTDIDASVGYYGGGIDQLLGEAHAIARPLMLHFGGDDDHITPDMVAAVRDALAGKRDVTVFDYPGAGHGFAAAMGARRNDAAAREADARTEALFAPALA